MKHFLYVGDNRNRANWGCRATSMALGQLISQAGNISGVIDGKESSQHSMTPVPWNGRRPAAFWKFVDSFSYPVTATRVRRRIKWILNVKDDFIDESPEISIERFLKLQDRHPALRSMLEAVEASDAVVINGEGTYIFSTPPRRDTLFYNFILKLGQRLGKQTFLLNAMFSDCPKSGRNEKSLRTSVEVLEACQAVSVRDPKSLAMLQQTGGLANTSYHPDALFTWSSHIPRWKESIVGELSRFQPFGEETHADLPEIDFDKPYICLSGSSSAAWNQDRAFHAYARLVKAVLKLGHQVLITPTCGGDAFLVKVAKHLHLPCLPVSTPIRLCAGIVGKAKVFISGRFHPSILASCGGTPCVFLGSNSHKTLSLQHMLEYDAPFEFPDLPGESDVTEIVKCTRRLIEESPRDRISEVVSRRALEARKVVELLK